MTSEETVNWTRSKLGFITFSDYMVKENTPSVDSEQTRQEAWFCCIQLPVLLLI